MTVIGHEAVRAELERELPPVTLLLGPESIGKRTLAHALADRHGQGGTYFEKLTPATAREIVERAPIRSVPVSVRIINLDNSSEGAQNILLKVLEEPPPHCRFILTASRSPLPTVMSRVRVCRMGLLSSDEVAAVLRLRGLREPDALEGALRGRGQVMRAMQAVGDKEASRVVSVVAAAVRSASAGGGLTLDMALRNWTPEHTVVARKWAMEAATGHWHVFTGEFAPGVTRYAAMLFLQTLSRYEGRMAAPAALDVLKRT